VPVVPTRAHFRGSTDDPEQTAAFAALPHREIEVPTSTLDAEVAHHGLEHVDLVKCDVEGAELLVLAGARRVLREHRPVVLLEADDLHQAREDARADDVVETVIGHGYDAYRYRRGALEPVTSAIARRGRLRVRPHRAHAPDPGPVEAGAGRDRLTAQPRCSSRSRSSALSATSSAIPTTASGITAPDMIAKGPRTGRAPCSRTSART
jgi:hypothetical protein